MTDQWQELKETIIELRDSDGTGTQQEVCKFLVNYMGILEKQMQEPCGDAIPRQAVLDIVDSYSESQSNVEDVIQDIISDIMALPPVTPQPRTGHWIIKDSKEQGYDIGGVKTWYIQIKCSECGFIKTAIEGHTGQYHYCPNCGAKMIESQESEEQA